MTRHLSELGADGDEPASNRPARVGSLVRRALQERLLRGLADPRVQGMVSITAVDVSTDMDRAIVRVSVLPEDRSRLTLSGLRSAAPMLRAHLREVGALRRTPQLEFVLDESMKRQAALEEAAAPEPDSAREQS